MAKGNRPGSGGGGSGSGSGRTTAASSTGYDRNGIMRTTDEKGFTHVSFENKEAAIQYVGSGATEWTRYDAPKGSVYVMPDGALQYSNTIQRLTNDGVKFSKVMGFTQRGIGNTSMELGPLEIKLNNTKTKTTIKTNKRGLQTKVNK